jgi:hypothetical protein
MFSVPASNLLYSLHYSCLSTLAGAKVLLKLLSNVLLPRKPGMLCILYLPYGRNTSTDLIEVAFGTGASIGQSNSRILLMEGVPIRAR